MKNEKNIKATIYYLLDEEGRKDAIKKGLKGTRLQAVEGNISSDILNLFKVNDKGLAYLTLGFVFLEDDYPEYEMDIDYEGMDSKDPMNVVRDYYLGLQYLDDLKIYPCISMKEYSKVSLSFDEMLQDAYDEIEYLKTRFDYLTHLKNTLNKEIDKYCPYLKLAGNDIKEVATDEDDDE